MHIRAQLALWKIVIVSGALCLYQLFSSDDRIPDVSDSIKNSSQLQKDLMFIITDDQKKDNANKVGENYNTQKYAYQGKDKINTNIELGYENAEERDDKMDDEDTNNVENDVEVEYENNLKDEKHLNHRVIREAGREDKHELDNKTGRHRRDNEINDEYENGYGFEYKDEDNEKYDKEKRKEHKDRRRHKHRQYHMGHDYKKYETSKRKHKHKLERETEEDHEDHTRHKYSKKHHKPEKYNQEYEDEYDTNIREQSRKLDRETEEDYEDQARHKHNKKKHRKPEKHHEDEEGYEHSDEREDEHNNNDKGEKYYKDKYHRNTEKDHGERRKYKKKHHESHDNDHVDPEYADDGEDDYNNFKDANKYDIDALRFDNYVNYNSKEENTRRYKKDWSNDYSSEDDPEVMFKLHGPGPTESIPDFNLPDKAILQTPGGKFDKNDRSSKHESSSEEDHSQPTIKDSDDKRNPILGFIDVYKYFKDLPTAKSTGKVKYEGARDFMGYPMSAEEHTPKYQPTSTSSMPKRVRRSIKTYMVN